jgi:hypothetical protein
VHMTVATSTKIANIIAVLADLRLQDKSNIAATTKKYHCDCSTSFPFSSTLLLVFVVQYFGLVRVLNRSRS